MALLGKWRGLKRGTESGKSKPMQNRAVFFWRKSKLGPRGDPKKADRHGIKHKKYTTKREESQKRE